MWAQTYVAEQPVLYNIWMKIMLVERAKTNVSITLPNSACGSLLGGFMAEFAVFTFTGAAQLT